MLRLWIVCVAALVVAVSMPARAMRVTNLDHVPHVVEFSSAGSAQRATIQPRRTVNFTGRDGVLALISTDRPSRGDGLVQVDGLLSSGGRTMGIPADSSDDFAIWPGGELRLQRRVKMHRNN